jgi:hypothetical protein
MLISLVDIVVFAEIICHNVVQQLYQKIIFTNKVVYTEILNSYECIEKRQPAFLREKYVK